MRRNILIIFFFGAIEPNPLRLVQNIAENSQFQDIDNYLPKMNDLPKYEYSTFLGKRVKDEVVFSQHHNSTTAANPFENATITVHEIFPPYPPNISIAANISYITTENYTDPELDPINGSDNTTAFMNRTARQEQKNSTNSGSQLGTQLEAQEEESEEEGNQVTGLISAFLGGLSRPDGSIDVEAITGLLGSLSEQNPDGTYNFMGLTDLIRGFFGGGEGGGGSDIGSFVGGLTGAFLQGIADPPGPKGVGKFTGRIVAGLLPSLSVPPPNEEGQPQQGIDLFGFLGGFLKTFLSGSSTSVAPANSTTDGGSKSKFTIFKAIVSTITSIFTSFSGSSSSCQPTMLCQNQNW